MELTINGVIRNLLESPAAILDDKESLVATCLVKGLDSFSKINKVILAAKNKPLSEAKNEEVGREISKVIFYASCIAFLRECQLDNFDEKDLTDFSQELDSVYQRDSILCCMLGIMSFTDLVESIYVDVPCILDGEVEDDEPVVEADNSPVVDSEDEDEDDMDPVSEHESMVASIFACTIVLCEILELDFGNLCHNATLITKA